MAPAEQAPTIPKVSARRTKTYIHVTDLGSSLKQIQDNEAIYSNDRKRQLSNIQKELERVAEEADEDSEKITGLEKSIELRDSQMLDSNKREGRLRSDLAKKEADDLRLVLEDELEQEKAKKNGDGDMKRKLDSIKKQLAVMVATVEEAE